ncbi:hypothetical protein LDENG_00218100 [Lucifuga dentata]|nr:hypothetical protein LDENG_00218100 [Lucifuga dentata]
MSHSTTPDRVSEELSRALVLCCSEPHAILLVLPTTFTFSQEEWMAMEVQLRLLHTLIWQRTIVIFTHGDKLGSFPIQDHIRQQGRTMQWLLERCGNRYQVMSNQSTASEAQVLQLFEKIQTMVEINKCPREFQQRMYTQLRQEVRTKAEAMDGKRAQSFMDVAAGQSKRIASLSAAFQDAAPWDPLAWPRLSFCSTPNYHPSWAKVVVRGHKRNSVGAASPPLLNLSNRYATLSADASIHPADASVASAAPQQTPPAVAPEVLLSPGLLSGYDQCCCLSTGRRHQLGSWSIHQMAE